MSAPAEIAIPVVHSRPMSARLISLDLFRGATIAFMIIVNSQTSEQAYWPLRHAAWNGWTPTDLVFPFFLFIVGVSLVLSFQSRLERGCSRPTLVLRTLRRSAILFVIGLALNGLCSLSLETWRIPGVLQRIALAYGAAALITLYSGVRARAAWIAALLLGYWVLMRFVPVPGFGLPGRDIPLLHPDANLAAYLDRKFMLGHFVGTHTRPGGDSEHVAGNRDHPLRSLDWRVAAIGASRALKSCGNVPGGDGRYCRRRALGNLVPD